MSKTNPNPRPDYRLSDSALEKRRSRHVAVTPDGVEIEITVEQYRNNVYERGARLSEQLNCEIAHVTTRHDWLPLATQPPRTVSGDGVSN